MSFINPKTLDFLKQLARNNNREWFNANKNLYLNARENFENVVNEIIEKLSKFDPSLERLEAKNAIYRIYRDIRFSKDKTPYKTNIGAVLKEKKNKIQNSAGYYIHLEPKKSFIAGGAYPLEPKNLKAIRQKISSEKDDFLAIINKPLFKEHLEFKGEKLIKVPQGFDKNDPVADYLKFKQFTVFYYIDDESWLQPNITDKITTIFKEIYPLNQFLNSAIINQ